jgi:predicted DNA-binding protein
MAGGKICTLGGHLDRIWHKAERFIVAYLDSQIHSEKDETTGKTVKKYTIENIRDFYYAVNCLKRIQEGRQAALLLEVKHSDEEQNGASDLDVLQKEISRVLERLQENGNGSPGPEDSMQD